MWIVCQDKLVNSDRLEAICVQGGENDSSIVGYYANDPYETPVPLGSYSTQSIANVRYRMLIEALDDGCNVFKML